MKQLSRATTLAQIVLLLRIDAPVHAFSNHKILIRGRNKLSSIATNGRTEPGSFLQSNASSRPLIRDNQETSEHPKAGHQEPESQPRESDPANQLNKELIKFRRNRRNGAQLAHKRLEVAIKERDPEINNKSFNTVFVAYAGQSGRGDRMAPLNLENLLQKMKQHPLASPSEFSFNCAMEAWVNSATQKTGKTTGQYMPQNHHRSSSSKSSWNQQHPNNQQQPVRQRSIVQAKNAVLRLFDEMTKEQSNGAPLVPNTYSSNLVLQLYAKSPDPHDLPKAEDWFCAMTEPDRLSYNIMFAAYANHGSAVRAEQLLNELLENYRSLDVDSTEKETYKPSAVWFHNVLKACAKDQKSNSTCGTTDPLQQADFLLEEMHKLYKEYDIAALRPTATTYNHILNVHAQAGNTNRVEELLLELEHLFKKSNGELTMAPDRFTYTTALGAYANQQQPDLEGKADELLQRLFDLAAMGRPNMSPTIVTLNQILRVWTKSGRKEDLQKATELLDQMMQQPGAQPSSSSLLPLIPRPPPPNAQTYTTLLHGWSRTRNVREAGFKAEEMLRQLEQLPPNARKSLDWTKCYNSAITAWSKSGHKTAPERVEALLNLLEDKCYESSGVIAPDKTTFLCIANTYAKARITDAERRCDDLLLRMAQLEEAGVVSSDLRSDRAVYNSILNALAKSGQPSAKDKAEEILTMMQTSPNVNLLPDIRTYASILDCHTKSGNPTSFERLEEILRLVEGSYRNGDTLLKPNAVFYSAILQAWAKSASIEGCKKAEWLLRRNIDLYQQGSGYEYTKPAGIMYNALCDAIARSGMPGAGKKAEEILAEMKALYEAGDEEMKPTRRSYNAVMLAYRHDGRAMEIVERILDRMEMLADTEGLDVAPNTVSYNTAMKAMVDDRGKLSPKELRHAASRAQALLDRMEDRSIRPDATTYSMVIEAWLKCNDEKGGVMADCMLQNFVNLVESSKDDDAKMEPDVVWNVVNAYRITN